MCELFGIEPAEFDNTGEGWLRQVHPADRARVRRAAEAVAEKPSRFVEEMRIVRPDGVIRRIRITGESLEGAYGETIMIAGAAEDISELEIRRPELAAELGLR